MKPLPWSHSALADFENCPRAYHTKRIEKSVKEERTQAIIWGEQVHKAFEDRLKLGTPLPETLTEHEDYLRSLQRMQGVSATEQKIALNRQLRPCGFFAADVWFRGIIDYQKITDRAAHLRDYKTGKPHSKFQQLKLFALYTFAQYPLVETVEVKYYWTINKTETGEVYAREQIPALWSEFVPALRQYAEAFKTDTWQPRQSGLCHGWCPVTSCEFWKPKRRK